MKYLVIKIEFNDDGTLKKSVYDYDDNMSARASYHSNLATLYKGGNSFTVLLIDAHGQQMALDSYVKPEEETPTED